MAVLADGWHMSSHALAIGLSTFAYAASRRYADDPRFAFGTWKIEVLAGYTSALFLLGVAAAMVFASVDRLLAPQAISYAEALAVALGGLVVNLACARILSKAGTLGHEHTHGHSHAQGHDHHHHDLNLKAAHIHVLTDALTSLLAIVALAGGWIFDWNWLDPAMGIVGAVLVAAWARNLIAQTGRVLLDSEMDHPVVDEIRDVITSLPGGATQITDLHVWRVGTGQYACALAVLTHDPELSPRIVRTALGIHEEIVHVTVEIQRCSDCRRESS
jgi:cation diffusion facilitator family transporter